MQRGISTKISSVLTASSMSLKRVSNPSSILSELKKPKVIVLKSLLKSSKKESKLLKKITKKMTMGFYTQNLPTMKVSMDVRPSSRLKNTTKKMESCSR